MTGSARRDRAAQPALFVYPVGLPEAAAACPNRCKYTVCTAWVPGPSPQCPRPGSGGGCCVAEEERCERDCEEEEEGAQPSIAGLLSCSSTGAAAWCIGSQTLELSADGKGEPLLISGSALGDPFTCPGNPCSVPMPEGSGTVTYQVTTIRGTASGSVDIQHDSTPPGIDGSLSGAVGDAGWFVSPVDASAWASDAVSGVVTFEYALNGGGWNAYAPLTLGDGEYTVEYRAVDAAGNESQTSQDFRVDATTPALDVSLTGATGNNGWYVSDVDVDASASDSGSGLVALGYNLDGGGWTAYTGTPTLTDGEHEIQFLAQDAAGNESYSSHLIDVDTLTPTISLSADGTTGTHGWWLSRVEIAAAAGDATSGIYSFEYSLDGGAWTDYTAELTYPEGEYSLRFRAVDNAGNTTVTPAQDYRIDTTPPIIELPDSWNLGTTVQYEVRDAGSGTGRIRVVIEDDLERWPKVTWDDGNYEPTFVEYIAWDGRFAEGNRAPDGEYLATVKALDRAGNETQKTAIITVETNLLTLFLPPAPPQDRWAEPAETNPLPPEPEEDSESGAGSFGGEENTGESQAPTTGVVTSGGESTVTGPATRVDFTSPDDLSSQPTAGTEGILWGAAAAAAVGAFTAQIQRRREEEAQAFERQMKKSGKFDKHRPEAPLTYRQIAKAYQASLDRFKGQLLKSGLTSAEAEAQKQKAIQAGTIPASAGVVAAEVKADRKPQAPPPGVAPEAQAAFAHGGAGAQAWITENAAQLQQSYLEQQAAAQERAKEERGQAADAARWTGLAAISASEAESPDSPGKGRGVAAPAPEEGDRTAQNPFEWLVETALEILNRIVHFKNYPGEDRTSDLRESAAPIRQLPTAVAGITRVPTAEATPLQTPTMTPFFPVPTAYITDQKVNFRSDHNMLEKTLIGQLSCGTGVQILQEKFHDGTRNWQKVSINGQDGWIAEAYLDSANPVCTNFAAKYATYPGAGETVQLTNLPFDPKAPLSSWWGFGDTIFAREHRLDLYRRTTGLHPGLDWGVPLNTPLVWSGNTAGKAVDPGQFAYLLNEPHIIVEAGGFHFIYGHTSSANVKPGEVVAPGDVIGYSGQDKYGTVHLHFEVRPQPHSDSTANAYVKSRIVINPLTFFPDELQAQWAPIFTGSDYLPGSDSMSLGYYMNTEIQP